MFQGLGSTSRLVGVPRLVLHISNIKEFLDIYVFPKLRGFRSMLLF